MKVCYCFDDRELSAARDIVLTIGFFDGVHRGHQKLIGEVKRDAVTNGGIAALVTFDPHPREVLPGCESPLFLTTRKQKIALFERYGIQLCMVVPFDPAFSRIGPEEFIRRDIFGRMDVRALYVGSRFRFGRDRRGDAALLQKLGDAAGVAVHVVREVVVAGERVSSTRIRNVLRAGDCLNARLLLGRSYTVTGRVLHGKELGRKLGVPTANLLISSVVMPPAGVYAVRVCRRERRYGGVLNIDDAGTVEVHIFDFAETIYGEELEVAFETRIRDEWTFDCREALTHRMRRDIAIAKEILHNQKSVVKREKGCIG